MAERQQDEHCEQGEQGEQTEQGNDAGDAHHTVLGHLMLNSLATMLGATSTLRQQRRVLDEDTYTTLLDMVRREASGLAGAMNDLSEGRTLDAFKSLANRPMRGSLAGGLPEDPQARAERFALVAAQLEALQERLERDDVGARSRAINLLVSLSDVDVIAHRRQAWFVVRGLGADSAAELTAQDRRWRAFQTAQPPR